MSMYYSITLATPLHDLVSNMMPCDARNMKPLFRQYLFLVSFSEDWARCTTKQIVALCLTPFQHLAFCQNVVELSTAVPPFTLAIQEFALDIGVASAAMPAGIDRRLISTAECN